MSLQRKSIADTDATLNVPERERGNKTLIKLFSHCLPFLIISAVS
jgi:hypothetical protein